MSVVFERTEGLTDDDVKLVYRIIEHLRNKNKI